MPRIKENSSRRPPSSGPSRSPTRTHRGPNMPEDRNPTTYPDPQQNSVLIDDEIESQTQYRSLPTEDKPNQEYLVEIQKKSAILEGGLDEKGDEAIAVEESRRASGKRKTRKRGRVSPLVKKRKQQRAVSEEKLKRVENWIEYSKEIDGTDLVQNEEEFDKEEFQEQGESEKQIQLEEAEGCCYVDELPVLPVCKEDVLDFVNRRLDDLDDKSSFKKLKNYLKSNGFSRGGCPYNAVIEELKKKKQSTVKKEVRIKVSEYILERLRILRYIIARLTSLKEWDAEIVSLLVKVVGTERKRIGIEIKELKEIFDRAVVVSNSEGKKGYKAKVEKLCDMDWQWWFDTAELRETLAKWAQKPKPQVPLETAMSSEDRDCDFLRDLPMSCVVRLLDL